MERLHSRSSSVVILEGGGVLILFDRTLILLIQLGNNQMIRQWRKHVPGMGFARLNQVRSPSNCGNLGLSLEAGG
jgi:hypothetical protein